ncbi:MAG: hypothetical protein GWN97_15675, partial [Thermoplasmata archaeon]|nr:hypothetical protein [Thermoplasmata archaeon]
MVRSEMRAGNGEFIENLGQWDEGIEYKASGPGCDVVFHADGVMYITRTGDLVQAVKVSFGDGAPRVPVGSSPTGTSRNYILGNDPAGWVTGVASYRTITYEDVWSGIDVRYTIAERGLKYDVLVGPDADPAVVRFDVDGGEGLTVDKDALAIDLARGATIHDVELVAWYGDGEPVEASFRAVGDGYGFSVEKEPGRALVIDPLVIIASTLLGGTYQDEVSELALDHRGDVIVAGTTQSTDYPVTEGAYSETYIEDCLVVTKMDRNLTTIIWSTYIGGTGEDAIKEMDLDDDGNIYLTGLTKSADFPISEGALQSTIGGVYSGDLYVLKLTSDGTGLVYSTYIGGLYPETPGGIYVRDGKAYVTAMTESADFPYGNISGWHYNGQPFVLVLSEDGSKLETIMSWKISRSARPEAIEVDQNGTVTISGFTGSLDLPTTPGAYMTEPNWNPRSFIIQCDPWTNRTLVCTYFSIGGGYIEHMAMDGEGNIYLAGLAYNWSGGVELTEGAWCTTYKGSRDLFLTKMNYNASRVVYSTLVGGNSYDFSGDLAVTEDGIAVFGGWCWDATGFETSENAHDTDTEGVYEGFVVVLNENGSSPILSTFLGGTHGDFVTAVEMTPDYTPILAGHTESKAFPVTEGVYQEEHAGDSDMFLMEYACLYPPGIPRNLTATGGDGNISLEWQPPLDTNRFPIVNYTIHRMEEGGELELYHVTGPETSFVDEDVEYGVYYTYGVTAFNGKGIGLMSDLARAWTVTIPDPPANLTGTVYPDHMKLSWDTPDFTGGLSLNDYNVYRSVGDGELKLIAH